MATSAEAGIVIQRKCCLIRELPDFGRCAPAIIGPNRGRASLVWRNRSFRSALLVTTTIVSAQVFGVLPENDVFGLLSAVSGWWDITVLRQPDYDPDHPLVPRFGTATTATSGGRFVSVSGRIDGEGAVHADAGILHPERGIAAA